MNYYVIVNKYMYILNVNKKNNTIYLLMPGINYKRVKTQRLLQCSLWISALPHMTAALRCALVIPTADGGSKARPSCAIIKSPPTDAMTGLMAFHRKTDRLNVWTVVIIRPDLLNEIRLDAPGKLLRRHIAFITFFNLKAICRENILWSKETWRERKSDAEKKRNRGRK